LGETFGLSKGLQTFNQNENAKSQSRQSHTQSFQNELLIPKVSQTHQSTRKGVTQLIKPNTNLTNENNSNQNKTPSQQSGLPSLNPQE
jgi:predicted glycosyltransferase